MPFFAKARQSSAAPPDRKTATWLDLAPARWGRRSYYRLAEEGYRRNVVAHRCVRLIADCAAAVPLQPGDAHPGRERLARPNGQTSAPVFFETLHAHLQIGGNAFVEAVEDGAGGVRALYLLRPDRVTPVPGAGGWPQAYEYRVEGHVRRLPAVLSDGRQPLLHLKAFHPLDDLMGLAAMDAAAYAVDVHNAAVAWNKALLDNAARPSGALVFNPTDGQPASLTEEQLGRLKRELGEQYQGAAHAGRPFVLDGGLSWQPMAMSPADMDFIQAKHSAARDIALAFGVPPMLLGIPGDNTYANYQEANRAFWRLTLIPLVTRIFAQLGHWLGQHYGRPLSLAPDLDAVPALAPEREALVQRLTQAGFMTLAEKRSAAGLPPQPDGPLAPTGGDLSP